LIAIFHHQMIFGPQRIEPHSFGERGEALNIREPKWALRSVELEPNPDRAELSYSENRKSSPRIN
jgi:hypothetical protein